MSVFYKKDINQGLNSFEEDESRHCALVLRHKQGDEITIFDGVGGIHKGQLTLVSKKECEFEIIDSKSAERKSFGIHLAIAPTKNSDRMEWMVEKLCEIGVDQITFIETEHSERKKLRLDRLEKKAISAMKQSGNPWLLEINPIMKIEDFLIEDNSTQKFIAHVDPIHPYLANSASPGSKVSILIGPEGDFSLEEVENAVSKGSQPISIGENTLRTETAGFVACCMINMINKH